jgi:hypothetical protein
MKERPEDIACSREDTARHFRRTPITVERWVADGCPRNLDGTFNLCDVHEWIVKTAVNASDKTSLQTKKLEEEIRKLQLGNDKIAELYILRSEHLKIMTARAALLNDYLEKSYQMTRAERSMRSVEELAEIDRRYVFEMMENYCGTAEAQAARVASGTSGIEEDRKFFMKLLEARPEITNEIS